MQHLELSKPFTLDEWLDALRNIGANTTFTNHPGAFGVPPTLRITNELKQIVDDFGDASRSAVYAVRDGYVVSIWLDPFHHNIAIEFTKASGDDEDGVLIMSYSDRR